MGKRRSRFRGARKAAKAELAIITAARREGRAFGRYQPEPETLGRAVHAERFAAFKIGRRADRSGARKLAFDRDNRPRSRAEGTPQPRARNRARSAGAPVSAGIAADRRFGLHGS